MNLLRWLHLSDFHIGKDNYGQIKLFNYIIDNIRKKRQDGFSLDMIIFTGDITYSGAEDQYKLFAKEFIAPLFELYDGDLPKLYFVPGNHDLDRNQAPYAAKALYSIAENPGNFFDADHNGLKKRI